MTVLRAVARPMLASMFVYGGVQSLRAPQHAAPAAQPVADALGKAAPSMPVSPTPENVVRANAAVHVVAGLALATGRLPRLASLALASTLPATTVQGHPFWKESDPQQRTNQTIHFLKNVSLMGGLLMATLDPDPKKKILARRAKDRTVETFHAASDKVDGLIH
ncbi:DoxX family protein [Aeromicrobium massiliense]|uniref:DoxX family protein n=1 Tax=Aeromicrobium massiliense TaxID=1464554 RepID=UPI0005786624|nr:DoxX family protein [Aeromicrobium massiliense]